MDELYCVCGNPVKNRVYCSERLSKLQKRYRVTSDMYDPLLESELKGQIRILKWVLEDERYISHDG